MEEGDKSMLEKLATLGFIKYGLSFDNYGSAGLTRVGIERLNREKNLRNPIKRTLSNIINYVLQKGKVFIFNLILSIIQMVKKRRIEKERIEKEFYEEDLDLDEELYIAS